MAQPYLSEIVTTTLRNRSKKLSDNVTRQNILLHRLSEKGNVAPVDGGRTIVQELEYAQNGTAMWYAGYQPLNVSPSQVMTAAEFNFRQAAVAVSISGLEMLQNAGEEQVIDLLESRIKNAEKTMENLIGVACYADGSVALQPGGLQFLVSDTPNAGVVGGINRATWEFWRNLSFSAVADGGAAVTSANIQHYMNVLYMKLLRGKDKPDLIIADNAMYIAYLESLTAIQRISSDKVASAGFETLKYQSADVVADGGFAGYAGDSNPGIGGCPAGHMYFLNTDYLKYRPHRKMNMQPLNPGERFSVNQDAMVKLIGWAGNFTLSNARLQGVLKP